MPLGSVRLTLRPLRFAFLVDPSDRAGIQYAIELSTFLWGGMFNPIVPIFRRAPKAWRERFDRPTAKEVAEGLIHAFDPDYVVLVGKCAKLTVAVGHRPVIHAADILAGFTDDWVPRYGMTILEPLSYFLEKELRFVRREPFDIRLPSFSGGSAFLAAVFGALPAVAKPIFEKQFAPALDAKTVPCTLSNYAELLRPEILFLRRFSSFFVQPVASRSRRGDTVFLLDATNLLDVIEYWNLRAVGLSVIPVAVQVAKSHTICALAREFIEENFAPYRNNPNIYNTTTLLKSRSISEAQLREFGDDLHVTSAAAPAWEKFTYRMEYPRIWNEWARDKDGVAPAAIQSRTRTIDFSGEPSIAVRTLDPKFAFGYSVNSEARFANEVEVRTYGAADLVAEVMPEGDDNLVRAIGSYDFRSWRFSRNGPVFLSSYLDRSLHLSVPRAEDVFIEWLHSQGWEAKLSAPGRIAKQLLKQVQGGGWGTAFLASDRMIRLLGDLEGGKTIGLVALRAKLAHIANEFGHGSTAAVLLERLVENQVVRLGVEVQCPICTERSWYSLTESDYELLCQKCNGRFRLPEHDPKEIQWSYRTVGPFSLPGRAHGVYTVLLAYRLFSVLLHLPTTPLLSFTAEKGGGKIEADLAVFIKETRFGRTTTEALFAECKTYDYFKRQDIDRMLSLSKGFPGAVLLFATLRKDLTDSEKKLMRSLVNRGRKYWKEERPYNPVLILTGTELFGVFRPEESWDRAGGTHAPWAAKFRRGNLSLLELCDATQQIYLGMKPWREWLKR